MELEVGGWVGNNLSWLIPVAGMIILPALGKIAAKTDNTIDDTIVAGLLKIFTAGKIKKKKK